jgi:hypothetical protein
MDQRAELGTHPPSIYQLIMNGCLLSDVSVWSRSNPRGFIFFRRRRVQPLANKFIMTSC